MFQKCLSMRQLFQIHAQAITSGLLRHPLVAGRILKFSVEYGDPNYAILVFRYVDSPDIFCVNTVIKAYSFSYVPQKAVDFYFEMLRNGFLPNSFTFPPLVKSCAKVISPESGEKCHGQAIKNGVSDVVQVQSSLVHMYACCGLIESARRLFDEMSQKDVVSWNSMVDGYSKLGYMGNAQRLFDAMPERNVVSWNIMIAGYLKGRNPGCGLKLFRMMVKMRLIGNETTMVCVLTACGRSARLKEGRSVHGSLIRTFVKSSLIIDTTLIDMYCKCKSVEQAKKIFDGMLNRNLVCWNAMVLGHCIHGYPEDGLKLFADMLRPTASEDVASEHNKCFRVEMQGIVPDEITFVGVLCACARAGFLLEGRNFFNQMISLYGIKPNFAHYWCMANLYCGVGLIEEAEEVLRNMPGDAEDGSLESLVWAGLLGLCRFQGDVDLGERIAKHLIKLEPMNASRYTLLSNIYAVAGRWEDFAKVKEMMKERGIGNSPGCSLMDLNEIVHKLRVRNRLQPGMEDVHRVMDELIDRLSLPVNISSPKPLQQMETGN